MEELKWYENNSLESIKNIIRDNISTVSRSFNAIGYYLKNVRDRKLYIEAGYSSILEFAHNEFNISQSWASRWMDINDRFSVDGNSPMLQEKYKNFGSSVLAEMLNLTDVQLEQLPLTTTRAEIRSIKQQAREPEKVIAPAQVEPELSDEEKHLIRCSVLKEMCDSLCKMGSYILEKNRYDMETIRSLSEKPYSFGFGDDGTGHSKYDAECKASQYKVNDFHGKEIWVFESGEIDQHIWNFNGRDWCREHPVQQVLINPTVIDDLELSMRACNCLKRAGIDTIDELCGLQFQEIIKIRDISMKIIDEVNGKLKQFGLGLNLEDVQTEDNSSESVNDEPENVTDTVESVIKEQENVIEPEESEVVEADVIHTESDNSNPEKYSITDVQWEIRTHTNNLDILRKDNTVAPTRFKTKMRLDAATALLDKLKDPAVEDESIVKKMVKYAMDYFDKGDYSNADFYLFHARKDLADAYDYDRGFNPDFINDNRRPQPALPALKNNDQRKEWIDNYTNWPVWIDLPHTGEKYYRYDLSNKVAIVVKVSRKHAWKGYKETKDYEYGAEQYYLLGVKSVWSATAATHTEDDSRTFFECNTNKSALVDYLRAFQKKGA